MNFEQRVFNTVNTQITAKNAEEAGKVVQYLEKFWKTKAIKDNSSRRYMDPDQKAETADGAVRFRLTVGKVKFEAILWLSEDDKSIELSFEPSNGRNEYPILERLWGETFAQGATAEKFIANFKKAMAKMVKIQEEDDEQDKEQMKFFNAS